MTEDIENHVLKRYQLLNKQGKGAYGVVFKEKKKKTKKENQIKQKKCYKETKNKNEKK